MIGSEPGFSRCLAVALQLDVEQLPQPDGDPNVFWRQWLAGRNLGLVPVEDPPSFSWPGHWLAAVEGEDGSRDAVLMFGVPSGPLLDPSGLLPGGSTMVEAVVLAPFQLGLDPSVPYGEPTRDDGVVVALLLAPAAEAPLTRVAAAQAIASSGLAGDRYASGAGTFSGSGRGYELTLIEAEALEALAADGLGISWEDARRNVVTRGIGLNALVGHRFRIGEVECVGRRLAEPCAHLQRLAPSGVLSGLVHRGGLRADILHGGTIRVDDRVVAIRETEARIRRARAPQAIEAALARASSRRGPTAPAGSDLPPSRRAPCGRRAASHAQQGDRSPGNPR